jgi:hypothetical protein
MGHYASEMYDPEPVKRPIREVTEEASTDRPSPAQDRHERTMKLLATLEVEIRTLVDKLEPVLAPNVPRPDNGEAKLAGAPPDEVSPVERHYQGYHASLRSLIERVGVLRERVDL